MPILRKATPHHKESVTVRELLDCPVKFRVLTGDVGLDNLITDKSLHRPQLALAGYTEFFTHYRVQLFGNTEFYYLKSLDPERRLRAFAYICEFTIPCIVCANDHALDDDLVEQAKAHGIAVLVTEYDTTKAIYLLSEFLDDQFAGRSGIKL